MRYGSKADIRAGISHVRFTPPNGYAQYTSGCLLWANSGHCRQLFDHLIGDLLEMQGHLEPQHLRGLEVDHELKLRGLHHRHIARFFTFEDPSRIDARLPIAVSEIRSVTHQSTRRSKRALLIDCGNGMA